MDRYLDVTKEIVIAMINKGECGVVITNLGTVGEVTSANSKAVTAAFEIIYAGLIETSGKTR